MTTSSTGTPTAPSGGSPSDRPSPTSTSPPISRPPPRVATSASRARREPRRPARWSSFPGRRPRSQRPKARHPRARPTAESSSRVPPRGSARARTSRSIVGFAANTFVPRDDSMFAGPAGVVFVLGMLMLLAGLVWAIVYRVTALRDAPGRPVIVPEYLPPASPEILVSAVLLARSTRAVASTLISFAVRGIARIVDGGRSFWGRSTMEPRIRLRRRHSEDGQRPRRAGRTRADPRPFVLRIDLRARRARRPQRTRLGSRPSPSPACCVRRERLPCHVATSGQDPGARWSASLLISLIGGIIAVGSAFSLLARCEGRGSARSRLPARCAHGDRGLRQPRQATPDGERRRSCATTCSGSRCTSGSRRRIGSACCRARRARSAPLSIRQTAPRSSISHERLLPYAVLFGVERDWIRQLGAYYESTGAQPHWYAGSAAFNASAFVSGWARSPRRRRPASRAAPPRAPAEDPGAAGSPAGAAAGAAGEGSDQARQRAESRKHRNRPRPGTLNPNREISWSDGGDFPCTSSAPRPDPSAPSDPVTSSPVELDVVERDGRLTLVNPTASPLEAMVDDLLFIRAVLDGAGIPYLLIRGNDTRPCSPSTPSATATSPPHSSRPRSPSRSTRTPSGRRT